ncbi:MAG: hypothetical protein AAB469_00965 [Patescibacteria group bacterium]
MQIINIASGDNFEDIFESVEKSKSDSLILVVPKSNRVFKNKNKVEKLKAAFDDLKKKISIISSGQEIVKNASLAGFNILHEAAKAAKKKDDAISAFYEDSPTPPFEEQASTEADLAAYRKKTPIKIKKSLKSEAETKKFFFILLGSAIVLFILIIAASLSKANVKIIPRKSDFSIDIPITISDQVSQSDAVYGIIPGKWIEAEKNFSKTFASTSEKNVFQKARGKVTIYNNFSTLPQSLVASTRLQTSEGFVFRIVYSLTVPGISKADGKTRPGQVEVEVAADRAGDEYNIEPSDFRIPGFLGTPKYKGFYAESFEKFSGGFTGLSNFVSKEQLEKAEEDARKEAEAAIRAELVSLVNLKLLGGAADIQFEKTNDSVKVGDLGKEFKVSYKVKAAAVAFDEADISSFISQYVKNSQNILVIKDGLFIVYNQPALNKDKKELSLKLAASGKTILNIDKNRLALEISGKKKVDADAYLDNLNGIESAEILSPFWLRKIPKNRDKIDIEIVVK